MSHTLNRVTVQGRAGPPFVHLQRDGPVSASVEIEIEDLPRTNITVVGIGIDAAAIAALTPGEILRAEGILRIDPETGTFFVFAERAARMVARGGELVSQATSVNELDRLAAVFTPSV
ncbi:MAG: hypothetical protein ABIT01_06705 [Thermoanaerobaculia bacterium]